MRLSLKSNGSGSGFDGRTGLRRRTRRLLFAATVAGILHHIDHVLRVDHSGWPFRPDVTPFTYSLAAYPILAFTLFGPARLFWPRWLALLTGTAFTLYAHSLIESPAMQYAMWAYDRSLEPHLWNIRNLCGVRSGTIGVLSVLLSMSLNVLLAVSTIAMLADGRARGRRVN